MFSINTSCTCSTSPFTLITFFSHSGNVWYCGLNLHFWWLEHLFVFIGHLDILLCKCFRSFIFNKSKNLFSLGICLILVVYILYTTPLLNIYTHLDCWIYLGLQLLVVFFMSLGELKVLNFNIIQLINFSLAWCVLIKKKLAYSKIMQVFISSKSFV